MSHRSRSRSPGRRYSTRDRDRDRSRRDSHRDDRHYKSSHSERNRTDRSDEHSSHSNSNRHASSQHDNHESRANETTLENKPKRVPIPIDELIAKKEQEKMEQSKPKFLTKEQRAQLAITERQKQVEEIRKKQEEERKARQQFDMKAEDEFRKTQEHSRGSGRSDRQWRSDKRGSRYAREKEKRYDREPSPNSEELGSSLNDKEKEAIRERYFGGERKKRKIRRMNERKFVFDWDAGEDTSHDVNPLYNHRHNAQMFGRGHIAGIDPRDQKKQQSDFYDRLMRERKPEDVERARELAKASNRRDTQERWDDRRWSEKSLEEMTERDWRILKADFQISAKGGSIPLPIRRWDEAGLPKPILDVINQVGYSEPTPIQRQAIPIALTRRDVIGVAETGSGKTASFVIPMLVYIMGLPKMTAENMGDGPFALIMSPTRELAQQIEQEAIKFAKPLGFKCLSVIGGHDIHEQAERAFRGAEIVVATPGRLVDSLERRMMVLNQCTYVVLDEADRMIDMGDEGKLDEILSWLPDSAPIVEHGRSSEEMGVPTKKRQTIMYSATMPPQVARLAKQYLHDPATVTIGSPGQVVDTIEQRVELINDEGKKVSRLTEILNSGAFRAPIIVFVNRQSTAETLRGRLRDFRPVVLHGSKRQELREKSLAMLKSGEADVLVATGVASRGIDIKGVSLVVNFDMSLTLEEYTHRIGRTGRAGESGVAITFLNEDTDAPLFYELKRMLEKSPVSKVPSEFAKHEAANTNYSLANMS